MPLTRIQRDYKISLSQLSPLQREVALGMVLGDASLILHPGCKNANMEFMQSFKQEAFVDHLFEIFREWTWYEKPVKGKRLSKEAPGKVLYIYRFRTFTHPVFTELRELFYWRKGGKLFRNLWNNG